MMAKVSITSTIFNTMKLELLFFYVHRNRWRPSDQPYDWRRPPWMRRWLMRPVYVQKSPGQWEQRMVVAVADVAAPFLSFLYSSVSSDFIDFHSMFDNERFHGNLQCVFEMLFLASKTAHRRAVFWKVMILHVDNMISPTKLWLHQDGVDTGKRSLS